MPKKSRGFELFFRVLKGLFVAKICIAVDHQRESDLLKPALFISSPLPWTIVMSGKNAQFELLRNFSYGQ